MKNQKYILRPLLCLAAAAGMAACDNDDLYLGSADTSSLGSADGNVIYVTDSNGSSETGFVDFSGTRTFSLSARTSKAASGDIKVTFTYDTSVLAEYNSGQETEVAAFPQGNVTLSDNGAVTIASGSLESRPLAVTVTAAEGIDPSAIYAIPLKISVSNGVMKDNAGGYVVLVQDCTAFPGTEKFYNGTPGMKIVGVIEVNDHNPLNVMGFTMKDSGKQFFDMVVLFSANINFNAATGNVYISRNENVQAILDNRDKYIKPLQARGIKVILGLLGNHDISGVSTMSNERNRRFAQEVKMLCDAYELDGVFLDDEYTKYQDAASTAIPGFHGPSYEASSRMAYEIKKAQPERLVLAYKYYGLARGVEIDGMQPGQFFDYVLNDYMDSTDPTATFGGLLQSQAGNGSWNCTDADWTKARWFPGVSTTLRDSNGNVTGYLPYNDRFNLTTMREQGYGALMIYNFYCNPNARLTPKIISAMEGAAHDLYNGELSYDGGWFPKDY